MEMVGMGWRRRLLAGIAVLAAASAAVVPGAVSGQALAASSPGSFHVFGVSTTGNLYQDTWGGSWTGWQDLANDGANLTGAPGIAYDPSNGSYHAFALGTNNNVYQDTYTPSGGWGTWQNLGGGLQGGVSAVFVNGTFHVFSVSTTGNLYQDTWGGSWTGWQNLGNDGVNLTGSPAITYDSSDGSYHAYAVGTNNNVYQDLYTPSGGWGTWQNLGGGLAGGVSAVFVNGTFHVFGVSATGNLYQDTWGGSWTGWQNLGNDGVNLAGAPGIAYSSTDGSYHAFALGTNNNAYQDTYTPSGGWGTWQNLGGGLQGGINATYVAPPASSCTPDNSCSPQTFADAIFGYSGISAPVTAANEYAFETWERAEGGGAGCPGQPANTAPWANSGGPAGNPINTTETEPGSTSWNSVGVQIFANADGQTCWYWGVTANAQTLLNGHYQVILNVLDNPSSSNSTQCVDLAQAVGDTPWGTGDFQADC
jgi:hypothetical protein